MINKKVINMQSTPEDFAFVQHAAIEQYEIAMEKLYNAIDTLSDVVQDQGDRGLIAVLNKFAFEPLKETYEKVLDEE